MNQIVGGCFCGSIRYEFGKNPDNSTVCYCADCRKAIGAQSVAWVTLPVSDFKITKGNLKEYESSAGVFRGFCDKCGTSLSYRNTNWGGNIDIAIATLEKPEEHQPKGLVYPSQKIIWDTCLNIPVEHDL